LGNVEEKVSAKRKTTLITRKNGCNDKKEGWVKREDGGESSAAKSARRRHPPGGG